MTVKELKNSLSQFPDEFNVYFSPDYLLTTALPIDNVGIADSGDKDESPIVILSND